MGANNSGGSTLPENTAAASSENITNLHVGPLGSKPPSYSQAILSGSPQSSKRKSKPSLVTMDTSQPPPPYQKGLLTNYPPFHPHRVIEVSPSDIHVIRLT